MKSLWENTFRPRVLVVGDLMLDRYTVGETERVSPEAPVLILRGVEDDVRPGGAANVASFLRGLDADVVLVGVVGDDGDGRTLRYLLDDLQVDCTGVVVEAERVTTSKQRLVGRSQRREPHHLLRLDRESLAPIAPAIEAELAAVVEQDIPQCAAVIVSDYGKGVCTPTLLRCVIAAARRAGVPVLVDPSRGADYESYRGATVLVPNRHAAELVCGTGLRSTEAALAAADTLRQRFGVDSAVITLDRDGLVFAAETERGMIAGRPRDVCDVTGAGDMVLAVLGLGLAAGLALRASLEWANAAAGLEVERFGVVPITRAELVEQSFSKPPQQKVVALEELESVVAAARRAGQTVVFTNGCFDLLHVGHVDLLQAAAGLGDLLIVALNSDASVRRLKGPDRPVVADTHRAALLAALACVDCVVIFDEDTPHRLLAALRPDVLVKGGTTAEIVGREVVEGYGGRVVRLGETEGQSTTNLLRQIQAAKSEFSVEAGP